jgi:hypothetical protein
MLLQSLQDVFEYMFSYLYVRLPRIGDMPQCWQVISYTYLGS